MDKTYTYLAIAVFGLMLGEVWIQKRRGRPIDKAESGRSLAAGLVSYGVAAVS